MPLLEVLFRARARAKLRARWRADLNLKLLFYAMPGYILIKIWYMILV